MALEQHLQKVRQQEAALVFPCFDAAAAWEIGVALRAAALARGAAVTIDIRRGEEILFFHAMPGTAPANADWARRKRNVVELLRRSSYAVGLENALGGVPIEETMGLPARDFACYGGSFPVRLVNAGHVGSITVSGLPQSEDHALVVDVLARWLGHDPAALAFD